MALDRDVQNTVPSSADRDVEIAASSACTRAGTLALLLSAFLFLSIRYWRDEPNYAALAEYLNHRYALADAVENLKDSVLWARYANTHPEALLLSLAQLKDLQVEAWADGPPAQSAQPKRLQEKKPSVAAHPNQLNKKSPPAGLGAIAPPSGLSASTSGSGPPALAGVPAKKKKNISVAPPSAVRVVMTSTIDEAGGIANALKRVNDFENLRRTQNVSNFFSVSIARWMNKETYLIYANYLAKRCNPRTSRPDRLDLNDETLFTCLSIRDVQALSDFELPPLSNSIDIGGRVGVGPKIEISPGELPRELRLATITAQILLVFLLLYFGVFTSEAVRRNTFPAPGTLFGGFAQYRWTRIILLLALLVPVMSSVTIAVISRDPVVIVCAALVTIADVPTIFFLHHGAYFFLNGNRAK